MLTRYRAAVRAVSATPAATGGGASAADPLDLLSNLFSRADSRAADLARICSRRAQRLMTLNVATSITPRIPCFKKQQGRVLRGSVLDGNYCASWVNFRR
ncbi:hypothetical protein [Variovorax paradoxus]|uniref:hypothetical protein n=1 Tax=Variovorax paradoxus TaxID=34073 RepID=UPI003F5A1B22